MAEAVEILLQEPVYHGGNNLVHNTAAHVSVWMDIMRLVISRDARVKSGELRKGAGAWIVETERIKYLIAQQLQGFAGLADAPMIYCLRETVELFPDATIIVNTRDREKWWESAGGLAKLALDHSLAWQLWPLRTGVRYWPTYAELVGQRLPQMCGEIDPTLYDRYMDYVKEVVPQDRINYYSLKDGWGPLCKLLGKDVPKDTQLPHVNDAKALGELHMREKQKGLIVWASWFGTAALAGALGWRFLYTKA